MKILHTVENYYPAKGGMQEVVKQLSERLVLLGNEVTVATKVNEDRKEDVVNGVKIIGFDVSGNLAAGLKGDVEGYEKFLLDSDFDIVTNFAAQQFATDVALPLLKKIKGKKIFVPTGFSGLFSEFYDSYFNQLEAWIKEYDANVFLAEDYRDVKFARDNGITKRILIPNGADEREFLGEDNLDIRKELKIPANHFLISHIGSHTNHKGHREAMEIFKNANIKNSTLVINGNVLPGETCIDYCKAEAKKFNAAPSRVTDGKKILLTDLERPKVVSLLKQSQLFLFPSNVEASPIVLFEAMASKTPFLTSNAGNSAEIAKWSNGGIVLPTERILENGNTVVSITKSVKILEDLYSNNSKLQELAENGFNSWQEKFTWEKITKEYEKLYSDVLENKFKGVTDPDFSDKSVDVIVPAWNHAAFILDTIKAIENQTVKPKQIIIVNDGSTDDTAEVIKNYKSKLPIKYLEQENKGPNAARNLGLKNSDAEFIAFCDADDVWDTKKLEYQLRVFATSPFKNLGLVYSKYSIIDEQGEPTTGYILPLDPNIRGQVFNKLLETNKVTGSASAVLIRKKCFDEAGFYDENLQTHEDWDKWLEIAQKFDFDYAYKPLVNIRRHATNRQKDGLLMYSNELKFLNKWAPRIPIESTPTSWQFSISNQIINRLSDMSFIQIANDSLSEESKKKIFNETNGSMKMYILKRIAVIFRDEVFYFTKQVLRFFRNSYLIITKA